MYAEHLIFDGFDFMRFDAIKIVEVLRILLLRIRVFFNRVAILIVIVYERRCFDGR